MNILCKSLKSGGTNYHFKWVKVPGTTPYWKARQYLYIPVLISKPTACWGPVYSSCNFTIDSCGSSPEFWANTLIMINRASAKACTPKIKSGT
jgi:hypothetical protein